MNLKNYRLVLLSIITFVLITTVFINAQTGNYRNFYNEGRSIIFVTSNGCKIKITPFGERIIRVQAVRGGEEFIDDPSEMVEAKQWSGKFFTKEKQDLFELTMSKANGLKIVVRKNPLRIQYDLNKSALLNESNGIEWKGNFISESFVPDDKEHFTGLGHGFFGKAESIDLKGEEIGRNYGTKHGDQSPLIVPFYLSSKGYGLFLNSTFTNNFIFNKNNKYQISINDYGAEGRMDYFLIIGPEFKKILDLYTQLVGRPRLPQLAMFGLGLSDKANDENSEHPSDEEWWKKKILEQKNAGIPFDHIINDNRWRAGGGKRCQSYFDWDLNRYPNPAEYESWIKKNGLVLTVDYNRCISDQSEGWEKSFNIPHAEKVDFGSASPDFTKKEVRDWFWKLFWKKTLDPKLNFPGDALWIDEFDELGQIADTVKLGNGKMWGEMKNYWLFLIAKSLVSDGWDKYISPSKRPFVWVRGMTAGAQRYATLWTGDIQPSYEAMKNQIIATQLAGLSGFPFEGHDAGGFYNWEKKLGPDSNMYRRWSMAFGSFTPFWKPHGVGPSRWPLDRTKSEIETAKLFVNLRYELLPYTYTAAYNAKNNGTPIARAMILDYQNDSNAWKYDLQYMWGNDILVVPNPSDNDSVKFWLPKGSWFDYWTNKRIDGEKIINYSSPLGSLILLVKEGSIIPMYFPALSTAFIQKDKLIIKIYPGKNGTFKLYEDDGVTEKYKNGEKRETVFKYDNKSKTFSIEKAHGNFTGAFKTKDYTFYFIETSKVKNVILEDRPLVRLKNPNDITTNPGYIIDKVQNSLIVHINNISVNQAIKLRIE